MQLLLFYDPAAGQGDFIPASEGGIPAGQVKTYMGWRSNWKLIIPGSFGGSGYSGLLFYDGAGTGEFYEVNSQPEMTLLKTHTGWQSYGRPWTHIIPGDFWRPVDPHERNYTDLLFYAVPEQGHSTELVKAR